MNLIFISFKPSLTNDNIINVLYKCHCDRENDKNVSYSKAILKKKNQKFEME